MKMGLKNIHVNNPAKSSNRRPVTFQAHLINLGYYCTKLHMLKYDIDSTNQ